MYGKSLYVPYDIKTKQKAGNTHPKGVIVFILDLLHHLPVTVQLVDRLDEISAVRPEPGLLLGDDGLPVAATEARHPLESADTVQGDDQQAEVDLPHLSPDQHELVAGVHPVGGHRVVWPTVGDIPDISEPPPSHQAVFIISLFYLRLSKLTSLLS